MDIKLTEEELAQLDRFSKDVIPNYTDEKMERMIEEWINFDFKENNWETEEQYEKRKEIMLTTLINEKLKRVEAEYEETV